MSRDRRIPPSEYEPRYPHNKVTVSESGHEVHEDDTPGKERYRRAHRSGTYYEIGPDGRRVDVVVGHHVRYSKGGETVTVDKNADYKYGGSLRQNVSGDAHSEVAGSVSSVTGSDQTHLVGGDSTSAVGGDSTQMVSGSVTLKSGGGMVVSVDGAGSWLVSGGITIESGASITLSVGGSSVTISGGGVAITGGFLTHNGRNVGDTHRHGGVTTGGAQTGVPA